MELYSLKTRVAYLSFSALMFIVGVPGNVLIIWTVIKSKQLRQVQNVLVAMLAVIDLALIGYLMPFNMYILVTNVEPPRTFCKINAMICDSLFTWSIQMIMLIALSRYVKICHSGQFNKVFNRNTIIFCVAIFFTVAFSFAFPLWFYDYLLIFDKTLHFCTFDRYGNKLYSFTYIVICLIFPISVTSFSYVKIYLRVKKSTNQIHRYWNNGLARRKLKLEIMTIKPQFVVFVAYLILYFPFGLTSVVGTRQEDFPEDFHEIGIYMCYFSSCINIFIYGVMNKNLRSAYFKSLSCNTGFRRINRVKPIPTVSKQVSETAL